jgi:hypothetical protein|tara:strand:+ start:2892 stop:3065 length:174 start_codon:yes stop_codon:yes gene_type:complete
MPTLSDEQLGDLARAYSCEQIIDILGLEPIQLLLAFQEEVNYYIDDFKLRPVDCHDL